MELSSKESKALCAWAGVDLSACTNQLELSGSIRNVLRHAEQWGPKLVAMLALHDLIDPGETPEDGLYRLLAGYHRSFKDLEL